MLGSPAENEAISQSWRFGDKVQVFHKFIAVSSGFSCGIQGSNLLAN